MQSNRRKVEAIKPKFSMKTLDISRRRLYTKGILEKGVAK